MGKSKIEWTDRVWNPVTGCTKVSPGCDNCYAERMAKRMAGRCGYPEDEPFKITFHRNRLEEPLKWRKPQRVFVCSMGDLFHPDVSSILIALIFDAIKECPQHTFMVLTKRPEMVLEHMKNVMLDHFWGMKNLWLGVTAENQEQADKRIPVLLQIPAAVRFISVEPMLGPVDLSKWLYIPDPHSAPADLIPSRVLHWIICSGESGPGARPCHPDWVRSLRDQCQAAGVPFFFKQWGEWLECKPRALLDITKCKIIQAHGTHFIRLGKKNAGRLLDGQEWNQFPDTEVSNNA